MSDLGSKTNQAHQGSRRADEIELRELAKLVWARKWLIAFFTALAGILSITISLSLPNVYMASALVAPAEKTSNNLSGLMRQYGGLASLAGVALPGSEEGSRAQLGMELIKSRAFIADFIERRKILPELMAAESWTLETGDLVFDPDIYDEEKDAWVREVPPPKASKPSMQEAHAKFIEILNLSENQKTGYIKISIEHVSPVLAAKWLDWLIADVNQAVKAQEVSEAQRSIKYLKQQVGNTSLADLQVMFFELIQSQTETMMLAEVRSEFVFKTIDPAVVPEEKIRPKRALICVLGTIMGGVLAVGLVILQYVFFPKRQV